MFRGTTFQRVYQYLRRHAENADLDNFTFQGRTEGTTTDCLNLFIQYVDIFFDKKNTLTFFITETVEYKIHHGLNYIILRNSWTYNWSHVRSLCSSWKNSLETPECLESKNLL